MFFIKYTQRGIVFSLKFEEFLLEWTFLKKSFYIPPGGYGAKCLTVMTTRAPAVLKKRPMGHFTDTDTFDAEVWIESSDTNSMLRHCQSGGSLT